MRARYLAVLLVGALLAGCGIPPDDKPRVIPARDVPFDLLVPGTTNPPTTAPVETARATIFFLQGARLAPVSRTVASPVSIGTALASLVQGVTGPEAGSGLRSAINPQTQVLGASVENRVATINVSSGFAGASAEDQVPALAQLVFTATELPDVDGVQISLNSNPLAVPRGDGSRTRDVLTRADYAGLAPVGAG